LNHHQLAVFKANNRFAASPYAFRISGMKSLVDAQVLNELIM